MNNDGSGPTVFRTMASGSSAEHCASEGLAARGIMHPFLPHVSFSAAGQASPTSHVRLEPHLYAGLRGGSLVSVLSSFFGSHVGLVAGVVDDPKEESWATSP